MALHGWTKTLKSHLLLLAFAVFLASCSGGDDGGGSTNSSGESVAADITFNTPVSWIKEINTPADFIASLKVKPPEGAVVNYTWNLLYQPKGSNIQYTVQPGETAQISNLVFTPEIEGSYVFEVIASQPGEYGKRGVALLEAYDPSTHNIENNPKYAYIKANHGFKLQCSTCHGVIDSTQSGKLARGKPGDHIDSSIFCQSCHTVFGFDQIRSFKNNSPTPEWPRFVDHKEVSGTCRSCHDNVKALGMSSNHVETTAECDDCHTTAAFYVLDQNGKYSHDGIVDGCASCHDGFRAKGKNAKPDHLVTVSDCHNCHTTEAFSPSPFTFDHNSKTSGCISCHTATPNNSDPNVVPSSHFQPNNHPMQLADASVFECVDCHTTRSFDLTVSGFNHRAVLDVTKLSCIACHDGTHMQSVNAPGRTDTANHTHNPSENACHNCHSTIAFTPANFDHATLATNPQSCSNTGCHGATFVANAVPRTISQNHVNTFGDDCGVCHIAGGNFANGVFNHIDYVTITGSTSNPTCKSCHDDVIAVGKAGNHIPTTSDCVACHDYNGFAGATVDHNNLGNQTCVSCHSTNNGGTAQPRNHIPTVGDCGECHAYPAFAPVPLSQFTHIPADYDGNGDTGCKTCHSGSYTTVGEAGALAKNANTHIPTLDDCQVCHGSSSFTAFAGGTYVHPSLNVDPTSGVARAPYGCEGCHSGKFKTDHNTIKGKADAVPAHIPTQQDCYQCHVLVGSAWTSNFQHRDIIGDCVSCHDGKHVRNNKILGKHAGHIPSSDICSDCHLYPNYLHPTYTWKSTGNVDHSNVTGRCDVCHIKAYSDANLGPNGQVIIEYKSATHQTYPAGWDCNACHAAGGSFVPAAFDHSNITSATRCDSCHGVTAIGPQDKPVGQHIPIPLQTGSTTIHQDCRVCHNTTSFAGATFNHASVKATDKCSDCHNGGYATGKPLYHVTTSDDCRVCHQTTGWKPGIFEHTQAQIGTQRCDSCHGQSVQLKDANGNAYYVDIATGKPANHQVTVEDCGSCHQIGAWLPAFFDHANITASTVCGSCHNGTRATGKTVNHIPTTRDCRDCHTTGGSFKGATFDHDPKKQTVSNCKSCHDQGIAKVNAPNKPTGHTETKFTVNGTAVDLDCDDCHVTTGWSPVTKFVHSTYGLYSKATEPNKHKKDTGCGFCHKTLPKLVPYTWPNPTLSDSCAGCHKNDFRSNGNHIGGKTGTVDQNKDCSGGGSGCHRVTSSSFG